MPIGYDYDIAESGDRDTIRSRIEAIYANRDLGAPGNIERQIDRITGGDGADYFDTIRWHADRERREALASSPTPTDPEEPVEPELPRAPTLDYRSLARDMFPWLTPGLLEVYADQWDETGNSQFALNAVRNSGEYGRVFPGIKRDDGSLRMSEADYFSEKAGFREALSEFGYDSDRFEGQFVKLFENEVGARELHAAAQESFERFVEPGRDRTPLAEEFLDAFVGSGSRQRALEEVRDSSRYDEVFTGNRREDGSLRMDEPEYFAYKRGWQRTLAGFGLNPNELEARGRFRDSVEGEQSVQEVAQRLQQTQEGILGNIDTVQRFYADNYGLDLTPEAILGAAIDPDIERDLLNRRITAGQIGGEASMQGFMRNIERAEELARAGLSQGDARELYSSARGSLRGLAGAAGRANLGQVGVGDFESAFGLSDADERRRLEQSLTEERAAFSTRANLRRSQDGDLIGLRQR